MKAAAAGNEVRVESLLAQPATLVTIFATDHKGRTALDWAQVKGATAVAETLKQAMERELRIKAQDRETREREHELRRLVQKNMHLRAILHHAINTRDVASLNRAVHAGQEKGDATSLQHASSARDRSSERIHASRTLRKMIARPKISRNEWKTAEIGAFEA